jgi:tripartite-type tricarboxylate transporter receptor subunit TctC
MKFVTIARSLVVFALASIATAHAQHGESIGDYPSRPLRMIIPFAPGGASDFVGRILQPKLTEVLGQQVVADNRPGASGNIGVQAAAEATPDGYTFLLGNVSSMGINPSMFPNFPVRALRDFVGLTLVVDIPGALGVHGGLPVGNLKEFIAYAKNNSGKLSYGSAGYGSAQRMAFEFFMKKAGIKMLHVPYKGGAGASTGNTFGRSRGHHGDDGVARAACQLGKNKDPRRGFKTENPGSAAYPDHGRVGVPGAEPWVLAGDLRAQRHAEADHRQVV